MAGARVVVKVAVLGEPKTGKSSIIRRYVDGKFAGSSRSGAGIIDFRQKLVSVIGQEYSYEIWDVPNWTLLENLGPDFWRDVSGCALVFDVTKASTFCVFDKLYRCVASVLSKEDVPLVVAGNMADREPSLRDVSSEMAESWCKTVGALYFDVSAMTGFGVDEMFVALAERAVLFYHHHHPSDVSPRKASRFSMPRPFLQKVTTKFKLGRANTMPLPTGEADVEKEDVVDAPLPSPSSSVFSSLPVHLRAPWHSKKKTGEAAKDTAAHLKQVDELQKQLEDEEAKFRTLTDKFQDYEMELVEKARLLDQLQQQLVEKDARCGRLEESNIFLQRRVAELELEQHKAQQASSCWEVDRSEVQLHKTEILGTGAWGYVVEGTFRGQRVAVKCLHSLIQQPHFLQTVRREIDIMAQLRHPHLLLFVAAVLDNPSGPLIITELLDTTLRRSYESAQLQESNIVGIFREVATALNYLHLQRSTIIHRDVSSANVLLERKPEHLWRAKLSDFGSANLMRQCSTVGPGAIVYAAPEIRTKSSVPQTPKVDVYSFGVMLAEVLLCQFPSVEEFPAMLDNVRAVWPSAHPLVCSCTGESPEHRPTMVSVLGQLQHLTFTSTEVQ